MKAKWKCSNCNSVSLVTATKKRPAEACMLCNAASWVRIPMPKPQSSLVSKVLLLAPGQWKVFDGLRIENTAGCLKRLAVRVENLTDSGGK